MLESFRFFRAHQANKVAAFEFLIAIQFARCSLMCCHCVCATQRGDRGELIKETCATDDGIQMTR